MLETMLKSGWNRVAIALKSRWNYDVEKQISYETFFSTSFQRQFAIFQRRVNVETTSLCLLGRPSLGLGDDDSCFFVIFLGGSGWVSSSFRSSEPLTS